MCSRYFCRLLDVAAPTCADGPVQARRPRSRPSAGMDGAVHAVAGHSPRLHPQGWMNRPSRHGSSWDAATSSASFSIGRTGKARVPSGWSHGYSGPPRGTLWCESGNLLVCTRASHSARHEARGASSCCHVPTGALSAVLNTVNQITDGHPDLGRSVAGLSVDERPGEWIYPDASGGLSPRRSGALIGGRTSAVGQFGQRTKRNLAGPHRPANPVALRVAWCESGPLTSAQERVSAVANHWPVVRMALTGLGSSGPS